MKIKKTNINKIKGIILILVVGIGIGVVIGSTIVLDKAIYKQAYLAGQKESEDKCQKKIDEIFFYEPEEIFYFSGKIIEIRDKTLVLESDSCGSPEDEGMENEIKLVKLTDATQIAEQIRKSPEELIKEQEAYRKAIEEISEGEVFPSIPLDHKIVAASLSDIKVGKYAAAEAEENIKDKKEFTAKKITLYQ